MKSFKATNTQQIIITVIYRLTLHPLAKYPGPFLAKITDLHMTYHAWKGDRHIEDWKCHDTYGRISIDFELL